MGLHALLLKRLPQLKGLQVSALHGKLKTVRVMAHVLVIERNCCTCSRSLHVSCAAAEQLQVSALHEQSKAGG
jgi:hypothetical protein